MNSIARFGVPCIASLLAIFPAPAAAQVVTVLHSFQGGPSDGQLPEGSLLLSGSTLFGMTGNGGSSLDGTIFQIGTNGAGYGIMHSFTDGPNDGRNPDGSLIQVGSNLFGMTEFGGNGGAGVIFSIGTDGSGFGLTHRFAGPPSDGATPLGSLVQSGSAFYGMTSNGGSIPNGSGAFQNGVVFGMQPNGSSYTVFHNFAGAPNDGSSPGYGALAPSGTAVYGTATSGGSGNDGTIFKMNLDGTGLTVLHSFDVFGGDGPMGSLILSGTVLYGMAFGGGDIGGGTVYKVNTDGSDFTVLHSFGASGDGFSPRGGLVLAGSELYGMTAGGGVDNLGTIFDLNIDGTGYGILHSFTGGPMDGAGPEGDLILSGPTFYGMTGKGGVANDGTVFSFTPIPEPSSFPLMASTSGVGAFVARWRRKQRRAARRVAN